MGARTPQRCLQPQCPQMWQGASSAGMLMKEDTILLLQEQEGLQDAQKRQEWRRPRAWLSSASSTRLMRVVVTLTLWAAAMALLRDQFSSSSSSGRQRWGPAAGERGGCSAPHCPTVWGEVGTTGEQ